jgi:hypothetical protein
LRTCSHTKRISTYVCIFRSQRFSNRSRV